MSGEMKYINHEFVEYPYSYSVILTLIFILSVFEFYTFIQFTKNAVIII